MCSYKITFVDTKTIEESKLRSLYSFLFGAIPRWTHLKALVSGLDLEGFKLEV